MFYHYGPFDKAFLISAHNTDPQGEYLLEHQSAFQQFTVPTEDDAQALVAASTTPRPKVPWRAYVGLLHEFGCRVQNLHRDYVAVVRNDRVRIRSYGKAFDVEAFRSIAEDLSKHPVYKDAVVAQVEDEDLTAHSGFSLVVKWTPRMYSEFTTTPGSFGNADSGVASWFNNPILPYIE